MPCFLKDVVCKKVDSVREEVLDSCCRGRYKLVARYSLAQGLAPVFIFYGIRRGETFPEELCSSVDVSSVLAAVGDFFPGMSPDDWDVLDKLYNESISACVACGLFADDSSREREDAAIEALVSFQKSHGLL